MMLFVLDPGAMPSGYGDSVVPLGEIKAHLRVDGDEEDDLIALLRDAAVDLVESMAEIRIGPRDGCTATGLIPGAGGAVQVGLRPIRAITAVEGVDGIGATVSGDPADFRVARDQVMPRPGKSWPASVEGVALTFNGGHETAEEGRTRFPGLVHAIRMMTAHLFANREAAGGGMEGAVPPGVIAAIGVYRMPQL